MRLIDADKLIYKHCYQRNDNIIGYAGTQPVYEYVDVTAYDVDNAPTIDAIPVEWIKRYASEKSANDKMDCYWQAEPNIEVITDMCLKRTKEYLKVKKNEGKLQ